MVLEQVNILQLMEVQVEEAVKQVSKEPVPDPFEEQWRATVTPGAVEEVAEE